ncbi:MAG: hypothetical protein FJ148_03385 [Deltaproteobacteria bacterium]|nr:hypothetical protein [Deltaproteobacteria bacterium]
MRRLALVTLLTLATSAGAYDAVQRPTTNRNGAAVVHAEGGTLVKDCSSIEYSWQFARWLVTDQDEFRFYDQSGGGATGTGAFFCGTSASDHEGITFVAKSGADASKVWVQEEATGQICEYDGAQIFDGTPTTFNRLRTVTLPACGATSFAGSTEGLVFVPDPTCTTCGGSSCLYGGYFYVGKQTGGGPIGKFCVPASCPTQVAAASTSDATAECSAVCVSLLTVPAGCAPWTESVALTYDWDTDLVYVLDDADTVADDVCVLDRTLGAVVQKYTLSEPRGTQYEGLAIGPGRIAFCEDHSGGATGGGSDCTLNAPAVNTGCGLWIYDTTRKLRGGE